MGLPLLEWPDDDDVVACKIERERGHGDAITVVGIHTYAWRCTAASRKRFTFFDVVFWEGIFGRISVLWEDLWEGGGRAERGKDFAMLVYISVKHRHRPLEC